MNIDQLQEIAPGADFAKALLVACRKELKEVRGDWMRLEKMSNGRLSHAWITALAQGGIKRPSAELLCELAMYLGIQVTVKPCNHFLKFTP